MQIVAPSFCHCLRRLMMPPLHVIIRAPAEQPGQHRFQYIQGCNTLLKRSKFILFFLLFAFDVMAQIEPYNLIAPQRQETAYLVNHDGDIVHTWELQGLTATSAYLLPDGQLVRTVMVNNPPFEAGGRAGGVERIAWDGQVLWKYEIAGERFHSHHDIEVMPNGNILVLSWERLSEEEALSAGREPAAITEDGVWTEVVFELKPSGQSGAEIVWQWRQADHLVQDIDDSKDNFGVIADHPELTNFNYTKNPDNPDWVHANALDYNEDLDQVLISAHSFNELWVIDHSTTTAEATGSDGGNSGKGGDLLYRWGNPQVYDRGAAGDRQLFGQHDTQWILPGHPGAGNILVFNNGRNRPGGNASTIDEIVPPVDANGNYPIGAGVAYGPAAPIWTYEADPPTSWFSAGRSGARWSDWTRSSFPLMSSARSRSRISFLSLYAQGWR